MDFSGQIIVRNLTVQFKQNINRAESIKEHILNTLGGKKSYRYFKALDNVSFAVKKGEVIGIIGSNGAGKSTLLKVIAGVIIPTSGTVFVRHKQVQLLTLGTGFDSELTARENVFLNGALIGYSKKFIQQKYDDIVKFSELEGFMEHKVKNLSTGMVSRLGFAIATVGKAPEILILDEVLSVGDMFFRQKSSQHIKRLIHSGSTVLIVSHSTAVIRENCHKALWLDKGRVMGFDSADLICSEYEKKGRALK